MEFLNEPLDKGLVTASDPRLLTPGQLQVADDVCYLVGGPGLRRARGRTSFGVVAAGNPVKGLAYLPFNSGGGDVLLAYGQTKLKAAPYSGSTGLFADLVTGLTNAGTERMDVVPIGTKYWWCNGIDANRLIYYSGSTLSSRAVGMIGVGDGFQAQTVAGTWPASPWGNGTYYFLLTEIYNANQPDEVESVFVGTPVIVTLTDYTTQGIKVIRDTGTKKWNDGTGGGLTATHWQVYISPVQTDASVTPSLSSFVRLGAPIAIDGTAAQSFTFGGTGNYASTNIQNLRSARSTQVWGGAGTVDAFTSASNCAMTTLTTLGAAIASAVATNIQVASSASLSSGMVVRIEEEQFLISGIPDGTHFDCVGGRGYNNTTATTHVINSTV